jgi:hypothetical protein
LGKSEIKCGSCRASAVEILNADRMNLAGRLLGCGYPCMPLEIEKDRRDKLTLFGEIAEEF